MFRTAIHLGNPGPHQDYSSAPRKIRNLSRKCCVTDRGIVTLTGASHSLANSAPRSDRQARTLPNVERCGSKLFVIGPFEEMALVVEGVVGRGVDVEEALR